MKINRLLLILLPPLLVTFTWYCSEEQKVTFEDFSFEPRYYKSTEVDKIDNFLNEEAILRMRHATTTTLISNDTKSFFSALNRTVLDKLGYFSELPIHKACLINKNQITSEKELIGPNSKYNSAIGIKPVGNQDLNFYTTFSKPVDCKSVLKKDLLNENFFQPIYTYPVIPNIGPEDAFKKSLGEPYRIYIREVTVNASSSMFVLKLKFSVFLFTYLVLIPIWSVIYFQLRKVYLYIRGLSD